jgi:hypothetical protein
MTEHISHLQQVLSILRANKLTAKMSKCIFATPQVEYLGHVINADGVSTDPAKVVVIKSWVVPKIVTQLRSFLDLTGYYRRFIKNYGIICRPLHDLLKNDSFSWTDIHSKAFATLKDNMTATPVLALPKFSLPFTPRN